MPVLGDIVNPSTQVQQRIMYRAATDRGLVPGLVALEQRCFKDHYAAHRFSRDDFTYYFGNPNSITFVASEGGRPIGYVLGIVKQASLRHVARVYSLAVDRQYRRQGIGTKLMTKFVAEARTRGCTVIYAEVAAANSTTLALFEGLCFSPVRRLPQYYGAEMDGIRLRWKLRD